MLRAKCKWIHESSRGTPETPAIRRRARTKTTRGSSVAAATTRSSRHPPPDASADDAAGTTRWFLADQRVPGVAHGLATHRQHVQETAIGDLDLHEAGWTLRRRAPMVDEPDQPPDPGGQTDLAVVNTRHGERHLRRVVAGRQLTDLQLVDRVFAQVGHRVTHPRIRSRGTELGDDRGVLRRKLPGDRRHERANDLFMLAESGGGAAEDPVESFVLGHLHPRRLRRLEAARERTGVDEA